MSGYNVPSNNDIEAALKEAENHLEYIAGNTNIKKTADYKKYIFRESWNFDKVANLDAVFQDLIRNQNKNKKEKTNFNTANFSFSAADFNLQRHFSCNNYIKKTFCKLNT
jgi:hypothetical protein